MSGPALTRADALHARLAAFRRRVRAAEERVGALLRVAQQPYVAFSGGKDSLCVLALTLAQRPDVPVVWSDDELEVPGTPEYLTGLAEAWALRFVPLLGHARHAGWFAPWSDPPYWRAPLPAAQRIGCRVEDWSRRQGYDGVLLGLRADERRARAQYLGHRGPLHQDAHGQWRANPLAAWSVADVWAAIGAWELPYHPGYDALARLGVPRPQQRIGPLPLAPGWTLDAWPGLRAALEQRYGPRWSPGFALAG